MAVMEFSTENLHISVMLFEAFHKLYKTVIYKSSQDLGIGTWA